MTRRMYDAVTDTSTTVARGKRARISDAFAQRPFT